MGTLWHVKIGEPVALVKTFKTYENVWKRMKRYENVCKQYETHKNMNYENMQNMQKQAEICKNMQNMQNMHKCVKTCKNI